MPGVRAGHWTGTGTGVTVVVFQAGTVGSGEVRGGAPATREFALLEPGRVVDQVDAVVLTGGSAFGLATADGVMRYLAERGRGFATAGGPVPIVPTAAIFDLLEAGSRRPGASEGYAAAIEAVQDAIARGDVYQVNLVQHLRAPFEGDPAGLAPSLAPLRPLHADPLTGDEWTIVSGSPELFLARRGDRVWTKPIKGTRPAGVHGELRESEKDAAEHVMIVDLERNDLSRVCKPGSVRWPDLMAEHELAGVTHMVTTVEGRLRDGVGLAELLAAVFPGGSVTGAPKISALDHIAALEPVGRGASMGALGRIRSNGDLDLALTIRTFAVADGEIHLWVGGGIVWDSEPQAEIEESWVKARPLLAAVGSAVPEAVAR